MRIVLEGLRGEESVAELCRREGISESVYYRWSKEFLEAGHPWELEQTISGFVAFHNNKRYHESLDNMTPADVFYGRVQEVKKEREETKQKTLEQRRQYNRQTTLNDLSLGWQTLS